MKLTRNSISIPPAIVRSPFVKRQGGFAIYDNLPEKQTFNALFAESLTLYWGARNNEWLGSDGTELHSNPRYALKQDRQAYARRKLLYSDGGPIQTRMYRSERLNRFLSSECGMAVVPTNDRANYAYYARPGDFVDLHRDIETCDLAMVTVLYDNSSPSDPSGAVVVYPDRIRESLAAVRARPTEGAQVIKLLPGQTMILLGGVVPHSVIPMAQGQVRVISVLCFRTLNHL